MRRMVIAVLVLAFMVGCQKKTETQPPAQDAPKASAGTQDEARKTPVMRPSDARITIDSPTVAAGGKGAFQIHYFGVEPVKALVLPLSVPEGIILDSVSFAGSMVDYLANKPVKIDNDAHLVLIGAVPVTEPRIPVADGLIATVHFTAGPDAKSGQIKETFAPPANYLSYVDTANVLVQPYFEAGTLTVQ